MSLPVNPGDRILAADINALNTAAAAATATANAALTPAQGNATYAPIVNPADNGYDVVLVVGQSNAVGQQTAYTYDSHVDPVDDDIFQFAATGVYAGQITQAIDPLGHLFASASGVGPGLPFARWYAGTIPTNRKVLIVPAAYAGTPMEGADALGGTHNWKPVSTTPVSDSALYEYAIAVTKQAMTAAGANARLAAIIWVQGESDAINGLAAATYRTDLEAVIDGLRARLNAPTVPFIIGSMLPEAIAGSGAYQAIDAVHQATPTRKAYTAFSAGAVGMTNGDNLHYSAAGQRVNGRTMASALIVAKANITPASLQPVSPPTVPPKTFKAIDRFARPDTANGLGSPLVGPSAWVVDIGTWGIISQQAYSSAIDGSGQSVAHLPVGVNDYEIVYTPLSGGDSGIALLFRVTDANNWYGWYSGGFLKKVAGATTVIGGGVGDGTAGANNRVVVSGSTFTFYRGGAQTGQLTDTSLPTGAPGLRVTATTARFDDLLVTV